MDNIHWIFLTTRVHSLCLFSFRPGMNHDNSFKGQHFEVRLLFLSGTDTCKQQINKNKKNCNSQQIITLSSLLAWSVNFSGLTAKRNVSEVKRFSNFFTKKWNSNDLVAFELQLAFFSVFQVQLGIWKLTCNRKCGRWKEREKERERAGESRCERRKCAP